MKQNRNFLIADLAFLCMLLLLLICILFMSGTQESFQKNMIILTAVLITVIITYFSTLPIGLVLNIVMIFSYATYVIVYSAYHGVSISLDIYFWIIWSPCMTVAVYLFSGRTKQAEKQNDQMKEQLVRLSGVDPETELKNIRSFERECSVYMNISRRYQMSLVVVVWQFRFQRELMQMLGQEGLMQLVKQISNEILLCLRQEDALYMLDHNPFLWGTMLFTDLESTHIVIERVMERLEKLDLTSASGKHQIILEMRSGAARFSDNNNTPFQLLEEAKKKLEYDV
ncbi:MAG TPA: diguanylate cyclase [Clostridia bacterium]|nr:diguanylate cyclase [Clostridia bacterium]